MRHAPGQMQDQPGSSRRYRADEAARHPSSGQFIPPSAAAHAHHEHAEHLKGKVQQAAADEKAAADMVARHGALQQQAQQRRLSAEAELAAHMASAPDTAGMPLMPTLPVVSEPRKA